MYSVAIRFGGLVLLLAASCVTLARAANQLSESYAAHARWKQQLIHMLESAQDADSLLAALLIVGESGGRSQPLINQMVAAGQSNPKVLWAAAMNVACDPSPGSKNADCDRSLRAARTLTRADAGNAMAWLAFAFLADSARLDPSEVDGALASAAAAPRFHDYGFDLAKVAVVASGRVPMPADSLPILADHRMSLEEARLDSVGAAAFFGSMSTANPIAAWVQRGCSSAAKPTLGSERTQRCAKVGELFKRGDSQQTLSANPEALNAIKENVAAVKRKKDGIGREGAKTVASDGYSKAMVDSYTKATNEREFWQQFSARLDSPRSR